MDYTIKFSDELNSTLNIDNFYDTSKTLDYKNIIDTLMEICLKIRTLYNKDICVKFSYITLRYLVATQDNSFRLDYVNTENGNRNHSVYAGKWRYFDFITNDDLSDGIITVDISEK